MVIQDEKCDFRKTRPEWISDIRKKMFPLGFEIEDGFECKSVATTIKPSTMQPMECEVLQLPAITTGTWMCSIGNKYCSFSCDRNLKGWVQDCFYLFSLV